MSGYRRAAGIAALLAALGALSTTATMATAGGAVSPATAAPGSDATTVATSFTVAKGQTGSNVATCPDGKRVVGGGIGQITESGTDPGIVLESGPVDETGSPSATTSGDIARSWLAAGTGGEWRVFAICSTSSDATIVATSFGKSGEELNARGSATCPAGTRAVGGGVDRLTPLSVGDPGLTGPNVIASEPLDQTGLTAGTESGTIARSWGASVFLTSFNASMQYRVLAICSAGSDATVESKRFTMDSCVGCGKTALVSCPAGKRALGGGVGEIGTTGFGRLFQSAPVDDTGETKNTGTGDVVRSWSTFANNWAGVDGIEYRVSAICGSEAAASTPKPAPAARCAGLKATVVGTAGPDVLRGTARADVIAGLGGNDTISGLGGNDVVCGGAGNDTISGGPGNDRLAGEAGNDRLDGGPGNDTLGGGPGNDVLLGGPGVDTLTGGPGANTVKP